jgi:cytochrome c oxidase accessory protein FixG
MFDRDTMIVSYDPQRGEQRGSRGRKVDPKSKGLGDCIDCGLCVQVCPTGIDIREGLQYQCISCAACIDVCDGVMDKMNYPRGLVRYDTQNGLAGHLTPAEHWRRVFRPRVLVYSAILLVATGALIASLALRTPFKVDVVRDRTSLARIVDEGRIENVYRLQIMNASELTQRYHVEVTGLENAQVVGTTDVEIGPAAARWMPLTVQVPPDSARVAGSGAHRVDFQITQLPADPGAARWQHSEHTTFIVPR